MDHPQPSKPSQGHSISKQILSDPATVSTVSSVSSVSPRSSPKRGVRRSSRPSTAPSTEKRTDMLPSASNKLPVDSPGKRDRTYFHDDPDTPGGNEQGGLLNISINNYRDNGEAHSPTSSGEYALSHSGAGPSPVDDGHDPLTNPQSAQQTLSYDWTTFINTYASGRWDPLRTPNPPSPIAQVQLHSVPPTSHGAPPNLASPSIAIDFPWSHPQAQQSPRSSRTHGSSEARGASQDDYSVAPSNTPPVNPQSPASSKFSLPSGQYHWPRSSSTDPRPASVSSSPLTPDSKQSGTSSTPELATVAAAMRLAASRIDLSPLFLPSPEHELTDPMRDHTTAIPGSYSYETNPADEPITPGSARRSRLPSFWQGTQDVDDVTRIASGGSDPRIHSLDGQKRSESVVEQAPPPSSASAPTQQVIEVPTGDYFGNLEPISEEIGKETHLAFLRAASPCIEKGTLSVPTFPRTTLLTRQTSSPLPATSYEPSFPNSQFRPESLSATKANWSPKEEQLFSELDYLSPPNPPDEFERIRALHKFNIWQTGPDLNFDRIAHLAKLVFNTKIVVISLIDGKEQWFKSEWGMKISGCSRINSFCGHGILQRGDEPMVILDSRQDWRFKKNPLVTGEPYIRFYAGAPLRTQDGFNIGSLAVVSDQPRQDFTPRQRHTLKEFAAIAMRELELWRDKIQLRIRDRIQDSMEQFSRECLEIDTAAQTQQGNHPSLFAASSMDKVYDRAAKLVKRTLDVEGVVIMDVSHCEVLETMITESTVSVVMHYGDPQTEAKTRLLSLEEYRNLTSFFAKHPDGKISEGIISPSLRPFLPTHIQYALTVPIFNIDKRPFALLCAYNASDYSKRFLEGHELSYLRAIGVIILSAVLKRRMIFADKAKSLFISNISHELRTPLHGILAAAELLADSPLSHSQASFLQTVQACGTSLVETVNHVLDFTKLVGSAKSDVPENIIAPSKVDLVQLFEEAIDGCWMGHQARTAELHDSEIGSYYSPPKDDDQTRPSSPANKMQVETVVDIGLPERSWVIKCEKGGIRRVLMNLFSNSLKFTTHGFIHVVLRQPPRTEDIPKNKVKVELTVHDTGKGISENFLKNQLFQPFSQENPLQTGTGLGLAIVNSIVQSKSVGGKVDVWSEEGVGTEVKVTFLAETVEDIRNSSLEPMPVGFRNRKPLSVSLVGFDGNHPGIKLLHTVLCSYLVSWWGFQIQPAGSGLGAIVILNNDPSLVKSATDQRDTDRPFIILSSSRPNPYIMTIASDYDRIGGFCRIVHRPGGPSRLGSVIRLCLHARKIGSNRSPTPLNKEHWKFHSDEEADDLNTEGSWLGSHISRRHSEKSPYRPVHRPRPGMGSRAHTTYSSPAPSWDRQTSATRVLKSAIPTIAIGSGGTLLESSIGTINTTQHQFRVLVVEDNSILRNLLVKWLKTKGYAFSEAVDGRHGVKVFEEEGPFDVVLLDLSMPILDGVGATAEIRKIESVRVDSSRSGKATRILALTGMSSLEDKQRAFEAGVDGYLVKPVAFKTLDEMFHKLSSS